MFRAIVRQFDSIYEVIECRNARDAYYYGILSLKSWAYLEPKKFFFLDLPELELTGCAYKGERSFNWIVEKA